MDSVLGTDSQDSVDLVPPGMTTADKAKMTIPKKNVVLTSKSSLGSKCVTSKGIENAKKRLRAFSIQKKTPITAVTVPKPVNTGGATVLIGKLSSVKTTPKPEVAETEKKPPKPPKPGAFRKNLQDSYCSLQKRTLSEIEDMKRKMELVDLGIPLGLICPSATSEKAMPTKAMPPIKSFLARRFRVLQSEALGAPRTHAKCSKGKHKGKRKRSADNPSRVDELIREAKKAKEEGREFKFDYQKLLPDYDNPFQRKRDDLNAPERKDDEYYTTIRLDRYDDRDRSEKRKSDKYERSDYIKADRKDDKDKHKDSKEKHKDKDKGVSRNSERKMRNPKETDVDLNDYLVCDSWSLDNEDRSGLSPRVDKAGRSSVKDKSKEPMDILRRNFKRRESRRSDSPAGKPRMEKLQPVIDAFKFDIDPNPDDDDILDIPDEQIEIEKFAKRQSQKKTLYESPIDLKLFEYDQDMSKEDVIDANDDNFLESVINEIKQENMSDDASQDKGLVEYDSPKEDEDDSKFDISQGSVTPELDDRMRDLQSSQQSHYSDGYRSTESYKSIETESYKSVESGYKSTESYKVERDYKTKDSRHRDESRQSDDFRQSIEKELDVALEQKMSRSTVDSLETWSFVLKICQPLLFRHDRNKCYKETHTAPKLWYTVNPKSCSCVKDRSVVYKELEMCKMTLVDRVYGCDQIPVDPCPSARAWYPRITGCMPSSSIVPVATVWETDDQATPPQNNEMCLDQEYQRFMQAVWPDVADPKADTSRSTTPIRQESRKMKKTEDTEKGAEDKKKVKKIKLSSEGWSQESDVEEDTEKTKKQKADKEKVRKRKHSTSSSPASDSEVTFKKKKRIKKKGDKKTKAKLAKRRRVSKKIKKKLKDKQKKNKKKIPKIEKISDGSEEEKREAKKKIKKLKKKKQPKLKKTLKKKKTKPKSSSSSSTSSSNSSSSSDSESEVVKKKKIKKKEVLLKKKKKDKKKKRRVSTDSTQSKDQELFDVNVLKNIKTERLTDDEKNQQMNDFSPRRQKPREREIINVKELQNDFVGNNILIKQEKEDTPKEAVSVTDKTVEEERTDSEISDERKSPESVHAASVEDETTDIVIKEQPSPIEREEFSPEILLPDDRSIPLPDDPTTVVHDESNIPLPAELRVQSIPEPPPQIIQQNREETVKSIEVPQPIPPPQIIQQNREETVKSIEVPQPIPQTYEYCYPDVSASHNELYGKGMEMDSDDKFGDGYEHENYEMYEQMAMAYQSDVANQLVPVERSPTQAVRRIETVVRCRRRGEIKCDWRAGDKPASTQELPRPSRWGLKPGEVNIVLTGGPSEPTTPVVIPAAPMEQFPIRSVLEPVYRVQSLANRHDGSNSALGYDEAYQVTYGAADRLQYGDCFGESAPAQPAGCEAPRVSTLDERITRVLRESVLGDVANETDDVETDTDTPEKGILVMKSLAALDVRAVKRVTFADGYRPGQDSDVEEPPVKRKKKPRRLGCAWPCPATHPDHVPLWDALPPPPPPRSPPPPAPAPHPPLHLLRHQPLPRIMHAQDSKASLPVFMPPEPPPGLITFQ